jgi:hypothetical protein
MAKVSPLINNFSAGEFGPLTSARVDLDRYGQSAEEMTNFIPTIQGAAQKRHGTKYVGEAAVSTGNVRLQAFVFSTGDAYILEFYNDGGNTAFRVYKDGAIVTDGVNPVIFGTLIDYTDDELLELSFNQKNDIIYVHHKSNITVKITRIDDDNWVSDYFLYPFGPYIENSSYYDDRKLFRYFTPTAATGSSVTLSPYTQALTLNAPANGYCSFTITSATDVKLKIGERLSIKYRVGGALYEHVTVYITYVNGLGTTFYIDFLDADFGVFSNYTLYLYPDNFRGFISNGNNYVYDDTAGVWGTFYVNSVTDANNSGTTRYNITITNNKE